MLTLSSLRVTLHSSAHLVTLSGLIYLFATFVLWKASFPLIIKVLLSLLLGLQGGGFMMFPPRCFSCRQVSFQAKKWFLKDDKGETRYEKIRILLEAGLFCLFEFSNKNTKTTRIVFFDQLSEDNYRMIKLLEKIS